MNAELRKRANEVARDCIAVRARLMNRIITNTYDTAMRPYGIKLNQASILTMILIRGTPGFADISHMLHMEKSTLSRTIQRMRKQGWVEVVQDEGGSTVLRVTQVGEDILKKAYLAWEEAQTEISKLLCDDGIKAFKTLSEKFWSEGMNQKK